MAFLDFGSPKADRASGSAVEMIPSGTGTFAYLRLCRVSRRRCSVWLSVVEGTAVAEASMGSVCDGCQSQGAELVWRPHSRLIAWPVVNHIGRLCWLLLPMPPRMYLSCRNAGVPMDLEMEV